MTISIPITLGQDAMSEPLRLACFGFSKKGREMLSMALQGPANNIAMLCEGQTAEAAIFNMDGPNAKKIFIDEMRLHPRRPAIVMSIQDPGLRNAFYLPKPVRINDMIRAINHCREIRASALPPGGRHDLSEEKRPATSTAENPATAPCEEQEGKTLFEGYANRHLVREKKNLSHEEIHYYNPRDSIQGILMHAMEECLQRQATLQLDLMSGSDTWQSIIFLHEARTAYYSMSDTRLAQLCTTPLCLIRHSLRKCKDRESRFAASGWDIQGRYHSFEAFSLKIALWTSDGRVPAGTDLSRPVTLTRWPNLTRLPAIPHAMPISALLIDQPRPLPLVAKVLGLTQKQVFTFYCAALSLGLIDLHGKPAPTDSALSGRKPHRHHTLFGSILKHLRGAHS